MTLVTGASAGVGRATAVELARRGFEVVLACRSLERAGAVVERIRNEPGGGCAEALELDLASLASVRRAAASYLASERPLHVLVNNAGIAAERGATEDGFELAFGVNHLGHFLLTTLLQGTLIASGAAGTPSRVINVSSRAHYRARGIDWGAVRGRGSFTGLAEYRASKLANVLFTAELARRLAGTSVRAYALSPGLVATKIWRRLPWPARPLALRLMRTEEEGARTSVYLATSDEVADAPGLFYVDCGPREPNPLAYDAQLARELWRRSEAWTAA